MIVNDGKMLSLDELLSNLTGSVLELVAVDFDDTDPTVQYADLSMASWSGVAPVALGVMPAATMDGTRASSTRSTPANFPNSSGTSQTAYGWAWSNAGVLIGCKKFLTPQVIADGGAAELTPTFYMDNLTL